MFKRFMLSLLFISLFAVQVSAQSLSVTWVDNSVNEEGFILERGGIVVQPDSTLRAEAFLELVRLSANITNHVDTTVNTGQFYCYRVAAYITVTNATPPEGKSNYSNISCGMNIIIILTIP